MQQTLTPHRNTRLLALVAATAIALAGCGSDGDGGGGSGTAGGGGGGGGETTQLVQMFASDFEPTTLVEECTGYQTDGVDTGNVVNLYSADYAVSVHEATTGKELGATTITATATECPTYVTFTDGEKETDWYQTDDGAITDAAKRGVNFEGFLASLNAAAPGTIVVLHACAAGQLSVPFSCRGWPSRA